MFTSGSAGESHILDKIFSAAESASTTSSCDFCISSNASDGTSESKNEVIIPIHDNAVKIVFWACLGCAIVVYLYACVFGFSVTAKDALIQSLQNNIVQTSYDMATGVSIPAIVLLADRQREKISRYIPKYIVIAIAVVLFPSILATIVKNIAAKNHNHLVIEMVIVCWNLLLFRSMPGYSLLLMAIHELDREKVIWSKSWIISMILMITLEVCCSMLVQVNGVSIFTANLLVYLITASVVIYMIGLFYGLYRWCGHHFHFDMTRRLFLAGKTQSNSVKESQSQYFISVLLFASMASPISFVVLEGFFLIRKHREMSSILIVDNFSSCIILASIVHMISQRVVNDQAVILTKVFDKHADIFSSPLYARQFDDAATSAAAESYAGSGGGALNSNSTNTATGPAGLIGMTSDSVYHWDEKEDEEEDLEADILAGFMLPAFHFHKLNKNWLRDGMTPSSRQEAPKSMHQNRVSSKSEVSVSDGRSINAERYLGSDTASRSRGGLSCVLSEKAITVTTSGHGPRGGPRGVLGGADSSWRPSQAYFSTKSILRALVDGQNKRYTHVISTQGDDDDDDDNKVKAAPVDKDTLTAVDIIAHAPLTQDQKKRPKKRRSAQFSEDQTQPTPPAPGPAAPRSRSDLSAYWKSSAGVGVGKTNVATTELKHGDAIDPMNSPKITTTTVTRRDQYETEIFSAEHEHSHNSYYSAGEVAAHSAADRHPHPYHYPQRFSHQYPNQYPNQYSQYDQYPHQYQYPHHHPSGSNPYAKEYENDYHDYHSTHDAPYSAPYRQSLPRQGLDHSSPRYIDDRASGQQAPLGPLDWPADAIEAQVNAMAYDRPFPPSSDLSHVWQQRTFDTQSALRDLDGPAYQTLADSEAHPQESLVRARAPSPIAAAWGGNCTAYVTQWPHATGDSEDSAIQSGVLLDVTVPHDPQATAAYGTGYDCAGLAKKRFGKAARGTYRSNRWGDGISDSTSTYSSGYYCRSMSPAPVKNTDEAGVYEARGMAGKHTDECLDYDNGFPKSEDNFISWAPPLAAPASRAMPDSHQWSWPTPNTSPKSAAAKPLESKGSCFRRWNVAAASYSDPGRRSNRATFTARDRGFTHVTQQQQLESNTPNGGSETWCLQRSSWGVGRVGFGPIRALAFAGKAAYARSLARSKDFSFVAIDFKGIPVSEDVANAVPIAESKLMSLKLLGLLMAGYNLDPKLVTVEPSSAADVRSTNTYARRSHGAAVAAAGRRGPNDPTAQGDDDDDDDDDVISIHASSTFLTVDSAEELATLHYLLGAFLEKANAAI